MKKIPINYTNNTYANDNSLSGDSVNSLNNGIYVNAMTKVVFFY